MVFLAVLFSLMLVAGVISIVYKKGIKKGIEKGKQISASPEVGLFLLITSFKDGTLKYYVVRDKNERLRIFQISDHQIIGNENEINAIQIWKATTEAKGNQYKEYFAKLVYNTQFLVDKKNIKIAKRETNGSISLSLLEETNQS